MIASPPPELSSYLCVAQVMRFFDLPKWALSLSSLIQRAVAALMPPTPSHGPSPSDERGWLAAEIVQREPFFNQMIANSYEPSEVSHCQYRHAPVTYRDNRCHCAETVFPSDFRVQSLVQNSGYECWKLFLYMCQEFQTRGSTVVTVVTMVT